MRPEYNLPDLTTRDRTPTLQDNLKAARVHLSSATIRAAKISGRYSYVSAERLKEEK